MSTTALGRLTVNTTQSCNLGCTYCYAQGGDYGGVPLRLSPDLARTKLQEVAARYPEIGLVQFIGGEPLANEDTIESVAQEVALLVQEGRLRKRPRLGAVTNLTILPESTLAAIKRHGVELVVSLDGPAIVHDVQRPTKKSLPTHNVVVSNIDRIKRAGVRFDIEATYTPLHLAQQISVLQLLQYCLAFQPGQVDITAVSMGCGDKVGFLADGSWRTVIDFQVEALHWAIDQLLVGRPVAFGLLIETIKAATSPKGDSYCPAGTTNLAVASDGHLYACNMFTNNARYEMTLGADAPAAIPRKSDVPRCRDCWAKEWCRVCAGNMEISSPGNPTPNDYQCELTRRTLEIVLQRVPSVLDTIRTATLTETRVGVH